MLTLFKSLNIMPKTQLLIKNGTAVSKNHNFYDSFLNVNNKKRNFCFNKMFFIKNFYSIKFIQIKIFCYFAF